MRDETTDPWSVLILHGWKNDRPTDHWQRHLAYGLAGKGHRVEYPQMPDPDAPRLERWLDAFAECYERMGSRRRVIVTHSLGGLLLFNAITRTRITVDRVLLIAPPSPEKALAEGAIAEFAHHGMTKESLTEAVAKRPVVVGADNDDWNPEGVVASYAVPLGMDAVVLPGQSHFTLSDGYGYWPSVIDWVHTDGQTELTARHG